MSEYRIGIIAEGETDQILIEGLLRKRKWPVKPVINYLSPTPSEITENNFSGRKMYSAFRYRHSSIWKSDKGKLLEIKRV